MSKQLKLAIVGQMGSGKDTIAAMIKKEYEKRTIEYDIYTVALAEGIRNLIGEYLPSHIDSSSGRANRNAMQTVGESLRKLDKDVWIDYAITEVGSADSIIITDCRLLHEAEVLRERGFTIIGIATTDSARMQRLVLRGNGKTTIEEFIHPTESEVNKIKTDYGINNFASTTFDDLRVQVCTLLTNLGIEEDNNW
jgi:dephospho-CoA kinase